MNRSQKGCFTSNYFISSWQNSFMENDMENEWRKTLMGKDIC